jgi:glycosyltransferase involved in cell wall biosynthesis
MSRIDSLPSISAIIPTYNRAQMVGRAISSAIAQRYAPAEIIVVDDGSVDGTEEVVRRFGGKVQYLRQHNSGASSARNRGVEAAQYEWVAFLDSDDYWLQDHLNRIASAIVRTQGRAALYFDDCKYVSDNGEQSQWNLSGLRINGEFEFHSDASGWAIMRRQPMMTPASVIRRETCLMLGGFPADMAVKEDTALFYKLCLTCGACAVAGCGAAITVDDNSDIRLTRRYSKDPLVNSRNAVGLYEQLRPYWGRLSSETRQVLIERHVGSYLALSKLMLKHLDLRGSARSLLAAMFLNPKVFKRVAVEMVKVYLQNRSRRKVASLTTMTP